MAIRFYLNGELCSVADAAPTTTVLDYVRERRGLTGTKEGCAEGDCGACTVVLERGGDGGPRYEAVNSCILMLPQVDGLGVLTVEGLQGADGALDPVQAAMADGDGTQCGFCTPGFIMALYALRRRGETIDDETIHDALAGNLCRCTGYRPIVDAARAACGVAGSAPPARVAIDAGESYSAGGQIFLQPRSLADLVKARQDHPEARLLAGGTDLGLLAGKERQALPAVIHTDHVAELHTIADGPETLEIGAAVTYTRALPFVEALSPSFATLIHRIGSRQIRNVGTIGGNIGNASPIGDTPPCLIAFGATLMLHGPDGDREIAIEDFFRDYRKTDLGPAEAIRAVRIPKPKGDTSFRVYKISKRYDQDISAVVGAFRLSVANGTVAQARVAFGGMAATPKRAPACEAALTGKPWTEETARAAGAALSKDFSPLSDHRASKDYRLSVAANLLVRLHRDLAATGEALEVVAL